MDAEPEIAWLKPEIYVVNDDGDKPKKRAYCKAHGLEVDSRADPVIHLIATKPA